METLITKTKNTIKGTTDNIPGQTLLVKCLGSILYMFLYYFIYWDYCSKNIVLILNQIIRNPFEKPQGLNIRKLKSLWSKYIETTFYYDGYPIQVRSLWLRHIYASQ